MKNLFTQHEIILVKGAGYYQRQLTGLNDDPAEKLEKACRNGRINDVLSRILEQDVFKDTLTLRHTRTTTRILKIELGSNAVMLEKNKSIDSVFFLATVNAN
jgi:hypothetical protein